MEGRRGIHLLSHLQTHQNWQGTRRTPNLLSQTPTLMLSQKIQYSSAQKSQRSRNAQSKLSTITK